MEVGLSLLKRRIQRLSIDPLNAYLLSEVGSLSKVDG